MMSNMHELALELCHASERLLQQASQGQWGAVTITQQLRAQLLSKLEQCEQPRAVDDWVEIQQLLHQARALELQTQELVTDKHKKLGQEYNRLQRSKKANKAYGSCR